MLVLWGTVPFGDSSLKRGMVKLEENGLRIGDFYAPRDMIGIGTTCMIAAAAVASRTLGFEEPYAIVAGDYGEGEGSRNLYHFLVDELPKLSPKVLTMHYILPLREEFLAFITSLEDQSTKPLLIADAGSMLIARATGMCPRFDLFTPDPGEMAFLADPEADHPAYVQPIFFDIDTVDVVRLIRSAYRHGNAPKTLLVKGPVDYIARGGEVVATIREPFIPALEPIGGTGDTLTGITSALIAGGYEIVDAATVATKINRVAGLLANPTPATRVVELLPYIANACNKVLTAKEPIKSSAQASSTSH